MSIVYKALEMYDTFVRYEGKDYLPGFTIPMIENIRDRSMPAPAINTTGYLAIDNSFKKFDTGKLRYDMIPNNVLELLIKVLMYGAFTKGYGVDNWKLAESKEDLIRYYNAGRRHDEAHMKGEYIDPESGLPHLAHLLCNDVFRLYLEEEKCNAKKTQPRHS